MAKENCASVFLDFCVSADMLTFLTDVVQSSFIMFQITLILKNFRITSIHPFFTAITICHFSLLNKFSLFCRGRKKVQSISFPRLLPHFSATCATYTPIQLFTVDCSRTKTRPTEQPNITI